MVVIGYGLLLFLGLCFVLVLAGWILSWAGDIYRAYFSKVERQNRAEWAKHEAWREANPDAAREASAHFGVMEDLERSSE
jgi:hypothetical protein